eukprot:4702-Heterococcus_DN1.PRE.8
MSGLAMSHPQKALIAATSFSQALLWLGTFISAMSRPRCADAREVQGHYDGVCVLLNVERSVL